MAEDEDLEILRPIVQATGDEETDEGADDEVEEGQHRPIVPRGCPIANRGFRPPRPVSPLDTLAWAAANGARARLKGKSRDEIARFNEAAVRETVFRYQLVLRINTLGHDFLERAALLDMIFSGQIGMLANVAKADRTEPRHRERWVELLSVILPRVVELDAQEQARSAVEARYLGDHPALFPDDQADWADRRLRTAQVAGLALGLSADDGVPDDTPAPDREPGPERIAVIVASFVEPAKVVALQELGDGERAYRTAASWMRSTLED